MEKESKWFRIAELERLSGVSRRTIHFYIQEGLLHPPVKTGKTMAYYDEAHLRKLNFIQISKQSGLPLLAIREKIAQMEGGHDEAFGNKLSNISDAGKREHLTRQRIPRKSQGVKTRETILELGCKLFREKGYKDTKVSDITKSLNIGKGTFYFYFTDKKELLLACVPRIFGELFSKGWGEIRREKDPLKRLELRATTVLPVLPEFCAILALCKEAIEDNDPKLKKLGLTTFRSIIRPLEADFERGVDQGIFQPVNPKIASAIMVGIMESIYSLHTLEKDLPVNSIWNSVFSFIANAVGNPEPVSGQV